MTKADIIRSWMRSHPEQSNGEVQTNLQKQHPTLKFSIQEIYKYRTEVNAESGSDQVREAIQEMVAERKHSESSTTSTSTVAEDLVQLRRIVERLGGTQEVQKILDLLR